MNTQTYVINIRAGSAMAPKVKVSQGDVGRILSFKIFDGAFAFTPAQGSTVTITGTKPSGLGFTETCTLSGSTATVSTTLDMTQESGDMLAELRIANGSASIGSVNFVLSVERAPHQDGTTDGTYETMDDIQTQIGDLSELATSEKSSLVGAINEAAQSGGSEITVDNTLTTAGAAADAKKTGDEISAIKADLGDLEDLDTTDKSSIVAAINEIASSGGGGGEGATTLSGLTDTSISNKTDGQVLTYDGTSDKWVNRTPSGGSTITVDSAISSTSTNPVQNKVIKQELDNKASTAVATTSTNGLMSATDKSHLDSVYADYSAAIAALGA